MQNKQPTIQPANMEHDEAILVVKRTNIFANHSAWHGLEQEPLKDVMQMIKSRKEFLPRSIMEIDPDYKQIIPYLVFNYQDKYFLMQRQAKASEQRLKNKYTLGIGGHIRQEDMSTDSIFDWATREFHEEVCYDGSIEIETLGILNDDSNAVGQVHLGLVLLVKGNNADISVKSELKSGTMMTLNELTSYYDHMETWSQMIYRCL